MLEVHQIPVLNDNYVYLIHDSESGATGVVDPAVSGPVFRALDQKGWKLTHILNTHHHGDHVGGNREIKEVTNCTVVGPRADADRIPGIDVQVGDGDVYEFGALTAQVFDVPGHTRGHIAYWFADAAALFPGDTLFVMGCGRLFEGTPEQMWTSLKKLRELPDETRVYCAHEYTQDNAKFALSIEPNNPDLRAKADEVDRLRARGRPTVPSTLGEEKATNPFLRADVPSLAEQAGISGDPERVFAEVRRRKDHF